MKRIAIALFLAVILAILVVSPVLVIPVLPAKAIDPIESIKPVPLDEQPTDVQILKVLEDSSIDKSYVEIKEDYNSDHPYSQIWKDRKSDIHILVTTQLPQVNKAGERIEPQWFGSGSNYQSGLNLFSASVVGNAVEVIALSDQPGGAEKYDSVAWSPQLFLDGKEIRAPPELILLATDPINEKYYLNTLEWDYGICKRRVRIIEGRIRDWWYFESDPKGEVRITHNASGELKLILGVGFDDEGQPLAVGVEGDTEIVSASVFAEAIYPVMIGGSPETFYPDANVETSSVDGYVAEENQTMTWAQLITAAGTGASPTLTYMSAGAGTHNSDNTKWKTLYRMVALFNTEPLPDDCTITGATLSLYGYLKQDDCSFAPDINIYSSNPASNTDLVAGDFDSLGTTAYCDTAITYANWIIADPFWNDFAFNAAGIAAISKIGVSKFGARFAYYDAQGNTPTHPGTLNKWTHLGAYTAEQGVGYIPKLVVTYTEAEEEPPAPPSSNDPRDPNLVYLELRPDLDETKIRGQAGIPTDITRGIYNGYSMPITDHTDNETLNYIICVPDRWNGESDILIHIDCATTDNETGNAYQWHLEWQHYTPNIDIVPSDNHDLLFTRDITSEETWQSFQDWIVIPYDLHAGDLILADDLIALTLSRNAAPKQNDTGEIAVFAIDVLFARGDLFGDLGNIITEEDMEAVAVAFEGLNEVLFDWFVLLTTYFMLGFTMVLILGLSVITFWNKNAVLFIVLGGMSLIFALYWFDAFTTNLGLTVALMLLLYALFCVAMAFRMLFWRGDRIHESKD